jgi:uncharacterized protein (DUF1015 family)
VRRGGTMPEIRPFRAWRYDTERAGALASLIAPPYDVISPDQQRALYERNPYNVVRLELAAPEASDPPGRAGESMRHGRARATLQQWKEEGILRKDSEPAFYLYRQSFLHGGQSYERRSLLANVRLSSWSSGSILPHERTLAAPRAERLALLRAVNANVSPIWALYEDYGRHIAHAIDTAIAAELELKEESATADDGVTHGIAPITARPAVDAIRRALVEHPLFIADGHHRYETALAYRDEALIGAGPRDVGPRDFVMMVLTAVDDPGLVVLPTHRLIHGLSSDQLAALPSALERYFTITAVDAPQAPDDLPALIERLLAPPGAGEPANRFALLGADPGHILVVTPRDLDLAGVPPASELANLDAWLAQSLILEKCLAITPGQMERQTFLTYTRDVGKAGLAVAQGEEQIALFLAATPVSQLLAVARAGAVMPQKSTYFYPKPATGLALRLLEP